MQSTFINLGNRNACIFSVSFHTERSDGSCKDCCLPFKRNQNIFLPLPFDLLSSLSCVSVCLPTYLSITFIPLCTYLSHVHLDLSLLLFLHLFMISPPADSFKWMLLLSHVVCSFLLSFCLFLFFPRFLFLIPFFLSLLSCSHWMDQFISFKFHILPYVGFI